MLQARIHGPEDLRLDDVPEPRPGPRDVIVRVASCGICGSDLGYLKRGGLIGPSPEPMAIGHELSGVVEAAGDAVTGFSPGDRVVLDPGTSDGLPIGNGGPEGGFTPRLLVRDVEGDGGPVRLHHLPDDMSFEVAALAEPLGVGMNAVDKLGVEPGEQAVVFGAGPIGLAAIASLRAQGVDDVVAVDLSAHRLGLATLVGARGTLDASAVDVWTELAAIHGTTDFMGGAVPATDVFVEASGAATVIQQVTDHARRGARLSVVALHYAPIEISFLSILMRELQITGAMEYPDDFGRTLRLLADADLQPMITHRFPLESINEAFAVARDPGVAGKVIIDIDAP